MLLLSLCSSGAFRFVKHLECFISWTSSKSKYSLATGSTIICYWVSELDILVTVPNMETGLIIFDTPNHIGHITILSSTGKICSSYPTGRLYYFYLFCSNEFI